MAPIPQEPGGVDLPSPASVAETIGLVSIGVWIIGLLIAISKQERDETTKYYRANAYARLVHGAEDVLVFDRLEADIDTRTIADSIIEILRNGANTAHEDTQSESPTEETSLFSSWDGAGYGSFDDPDTVARLIADIEAARAEIAKRRKDSIRSV
ncbi:hypothetical protein K491DRAFT_721431 [Lophiostoma macrostomum CBS 122681]|uniref:Uncharacterized protein n=1 Tax=Lophiostoma macrostomum CBS 122681 TaxID=1314788 RepID=A0A6A6SPR6_9PLEO|nr:hypothetical protein K491DRAFT_721431 [Lophiostoma macrostomum CBS 122681]